LTNRKLNAVEFQEAIMCASYPLAFPRRTQTHQSINKNLFSAASGFLLRGAPQPGHEDKSVYPINFITFSSDEINF